MTELDHHDHEAMIALDVRGEEALGDAFYVRDGRRPDTAEVAVTVVDEWQGRRLGMLLLEVISARALDEGVGTFTALMLARNEAMMDLFERLGPGRRAGGRDGRNRGRDPRRRGRPRAQGAAPAGVEAWSGSSTVSRVPWPGQLSRVKPPPPASTRSFRPTRPEQRDGSAPPAPLVAALQPEGTAAPADAHVAGGGVRMLGDVRRRLRDDVVRRHFDASGQAAVEVRRPA